MALKISELQTAIDDGKGVTLASQFQVVMTLPDALTSTIAGYDSASMCIYCQAVGMPGTQIATTELPVYGPPMKMPYGLVYQDLTLQFICTNNMAQRKVFEEWRRIVVDPTSNYVNYYDTYVGEIWIWKLDQAGKFVHGVYVEEVYPVAIMEQELSYQNNEWLRMTVQMSYRRWRGIYDIIAATKAGFGSQDPNPQPPGKEPNLEDPFRNTPAPKPPKFEP
jgi:hypothetical protein